MARAPARRLRTGNRRRGAKKNKTRHLRHMHLSHAQVGFMEELHQRTLYEGSVAYVSIVTVPQLILLYAHVRDTIGDELSQALVMTL